MNERTSVTRTDETQQQCLLAEMLQMTCVWEAIYRGHVLLRKNTIQWNDVQEFKNMMMNRRIYSKIMRSVTSPVVISQFLYHHVFINLCHNIFYSYIYIILLCCGQTSQHRNWQVTPYGSGILHHHSCRDPSGEVGFLVCCSPFVGEELKETSRTYSTHILVLFWWIRENPHTRVLTRCCHGNQITFHKYRLYI